MSHPPPAKKTESANLFVKNLVATIDDNRLRELFSPFGTVTSAKIARNDAGESKKHGFVCYGADSEAALKAIFYMNGRLIAGKPIYVNVAQKREERSKLLAAQFSKSKDVSKTTETGDDEVML
ncbi:AAEL007013-PA [Aedes aegypti]|nr:AAEL007013-PA [Aedes aegypti]